DRISVHAAELQRRRLREKNVAVRTGAGGEESGAAWLAADAVDFGLDFPVSAGGLFPGRTDKSRASEIHSGVRYVRISAARGEQEHRHQTCDTRGTTTHGNPRPTTSV